MIISQFQEMKVRVRVDGVAWLHKKRKLHLRCGATEPESTRSIMIMMAIQRLLDDIKLHSFHAEHQWSLNGR